MPIKLGSIVRCKITGFKGTAIAELRNLTGLLEYKVQPGLDSSGGFREPRWFDQMLLKVTAEPKEED